MVNKCSSTSVWEAKDAFELFEPHTDRLFDIKRVASVLSYDTSCVWSVFKSHLYVRALPTDLPSQFFPLKIDATVTLCFNISVFYRLEKCEVHESHLCQLLLTYKGAETVCSWDVKVNMLTTMCRLLLKHFPNNLMPYFPSTDITLLNFTQIR